jgi:hypothetical protein
MISLRAIAASAAVSAALSAGATWRATSNYYQAQQEAVIASQRVLQAEAERDAARRLAAAQTANQILADQLEQTYAKTRQDLDAALADNRRLIRDLGGLRDPGTRSDCRMPAPAPAPSQSADCATGARLSEEAEEFLLAFARDADRAAEYAVACHQWIKAIAEQPAAG